MIRRFHTAVLVAVAAAAVSLAGRAAQDSGTIRSGRPARLIFWS
jgi:hypothetical protein